MMFTKSVTSLVFTTVAVAVIGFVAGNVDDVDLESILGPDSLSVYDYSYDISIDDNCNYTYVTKFSHNPTFPVGGPDTCLPGVDADDGRPYIEGRWRYQRLPEYQRNAVGIDHPSIDWNPCGHPGPGFLTAHYDVHFYKVSPTFRAVNMTCYLLPGTPACEYGAQDTENGLAFFTVNWLDPTTDNDQGGEDDDTTVTDGDAVMTEEIATTTTDEEIRPIINMPLGYVAHPNDAVIHMGLHAWDMQQEPAVPDDWKNPIWIICTFGLGLAAIEPMLPLPYYDGDESKFWEEDLNYVATSDPTLPHYYSVDYNADTREITIVMKGRSNTCKAEYDALDEAYKAEQEMKDPMSSASIMSSSTVVSMVFLTTTLLSYVAII